MASPIEQKLTNAIKLALRLLKSETEGEEEIKPEDQFALPKLDKDDPDKNVIELESKIEEAANFMEQLNSAIDGIQIGVEDWTNLTKKCTAAERPEIEERYNAFAKKQNLSNTLELAEILLDKVQKKKANLSREVRHQMLTIKRREEAKGANQPTQNAPTGTAKTKETKTEAIHHEALKIEKFRGAENESWSEWWELFCSIHLDEKLTDERKFLYLRSYIPKESTAGQLIAGFSPSEYRDAIDLLKENFGQDKKRIRSLQQQLFGIPICTSLEDVRKMYLAVERICRQLTNLGQDTEGDHYYNALEGKLTRSMLREMLEAKNRAGDDWSTSQFRIELKNLVEAEMEISAILKHAKGEDDPKTIKKGKNDSPKFNKDSSPSVACPAVGENSKGNKKEWQKGKKEKKKWPCTFDCQGGDHWSSECKQFGTVDARYQRLKELKKCVKCCRPGHYADKCPKPIKCAGCEGNHPLALCKKQPIPQLPKYLLEKKGEGNNEKKPEWKRSPATGANATAITEPAQNINASLTTSLQTKLPSFQYCLLRCREAKLFNPFNPGKKATGTVFIDPGSQKNMISERMADLLGLKKEGSEEFKLRGVGPPTKANEYKADLVKIGMETKEVPMEMVLSIVPNGHFPAMITVAVDNEEAAFLDCNPLEAKYKIEAPDVLIGAKYYNELELEKVRKLPSGFWLFQSNIGPMLESEGNLGNITALVTQLPPMNSTLMEEENSLYERVRQFCKNDSLYLESDEMTADEVDKIVHERFKSALKLDPEEKRYEIELPFKMDEIEKLPTNYSIAKSRLFSVLKQLNGDEKMMEKYKAKMNELLEKDMAELAPREPDGPVHYLPQQIVWNEEKQKLRIVFDASSHSAKAICLNDALHQGPLLMKDLTGILMRFRLPKIVITADLEAAFLQLKVAKSHRDVTRYLWPDNPHDPESIIRAYRFKRLTFGLNCAPYCLNAALDEHLKKYEGNKTAKLIGENLYVDNILLNVDHPKESLAICKEAKSIFRDAGFNLREFASNDIELMRKLPLEDRLTGMLSGERIKVLGIVWDTAKDTIILKLPETEKNGSVVTKRTVLSQIASAWDPPGLISPTLLLAKNFLQKLWEKVGDKNSWDTQLNENDCDEWKKISSTWKEGSNLVLPRRLFSGDRERKKFELHGFADASGVGLGIAVYLRAIEGEKAETRLIFARSKVIPKQPKKRTIPRLETQAAFLASKILMKVKTEIGLSLEKVQLWTDSENLVKWLCIKESQKDAYLNRRLEAISHFDVRHVKGEDNPADIASRGMNGEKLALTTCWFNGPLWMSKLEDEWPNSSNFIYLANVGRKDKDEKIFYSICSAEIAQEEEKLPNELFRAYGISTSYMQLKNGTRHKTALRKQKGAAAYVVRFLVLKLEKVKNAHPFLEEMRQIAKKGQITAEELEFAEKVIILDAQKNFPADEHLKHSLGGILKDEDGILRLKGGRLDHSDLPYSAKWPIYIPKKSKLAFLLLEDSHAETMQGKSTAIARIRQRFWIPAIRQLLGKVLRNCMKCRPFKAKPLNAPAAPPIPSCRVVRAAAWAHVGVYYTGPFTIYANKMAEKRWICLFNCLTTRAVHLEMAMDASAAAFLKCFRRFCAMCRVPELVISDNGTNFTASAKMLTELWKKVAMDPSVQSHMATKNIKWKFVTERAPWRNGFTETLNRGIKAALRATFGRQKLDDEEMTTILYELSAILNERPLTYLSEEVGEVALTPSRLIKLELDESGVSPNFDLDDPNDPEYQPKKMARDELTKGYEKAILRQNKFWEIWRSHYLVGLRERQQKELKNGNDLEPKVGKIVLVEEENAPRNVWRMGKIEKLIKGEGGIRTAHLRVTGSKNLWKRAINHLYPLEIEGEELGINGENLGEFVEAFVLNENSTDNSTQFIAAVTMDEEELLDYDDFPDEPMPTTEEKEENAQKLPKIRKFPEFQKQPEGRDATGRLKSKVVVVKNKEERSNRRFRPIARPPRTYHNRAYRNVRFDISPIRQVDSTNEPIENFRQEERAKRNGPKDHSRFRELAHEEGNKMAKLTPMLIYPKEWQLEEKCTPGYGKHNECQILTVGNMLGKWGKAFVLLKLPADLPITTLIECLMTNWILRSIDCSSEEKFQRYQKLKEILAFTRKNPTLGLKNWEEKRRELKTVSKLDNDWPLAEVSWLVEVRKKHCRMAAEAFDQDCHKAVQPPTTMPEASLELTTFLGMRLARALTDLRAKEFYVGCRIAHSTTFIIGDEVANQFAKARMPIYSTVPLKVNQLANLIPSSYYLGNEVQNILIWMGGQHINEENGSTGTLINGLEKLLQILEVYGKRVILITPAICNKKENEMKRLMKIMGELCLQKGAVFLQPAFSTTKGCPKYVDKNGIINSAGMELLEEELLIKGVELEAKISSTQKKKMEKMEKNEESAKKPSIVERLSIVGQSVTNRLSLDPRSTKKAAGIALATLGSIPGTSAQREMNESESTSNWALFSTLFLLVTALIILGINAIGKKKGNAKKLNIGIAIFLMILAGSVSSETAFWCKDGDSQLWDLNVEIPCPKIAISENWKNVTIDVYDKIEAPMAISALRCNIQMDLVEYYLNWFGDKFPKKKEKSLSIEEEECLLMGRKKKCGNWEMTPTLGGGWGTKNPLETPGPGLWNRIWMNSVTSNTTNCYVHNITIFADRKTWEIKTPGAVRKQHCWLRNSSCPLEDGGIIKWPQFMYINSCNYAKIKQQWQGEFNEEQQIFSTHERDFVLSWAKPKIEKDCNSTMELIVSDQGLAIPTSQWTNMHQKSRKTREIASAAQVAGADTAGSFSAIRAINRTIAALQHNDCIQKRKEIAQLPYIFAKNPIGAAKYLFNRTMLANWRGHGLLEILCFLLALLITKIRHDQWIWQKMFATNPQVPRGHQQMEASSSEESIEPRTRKRLIRAARRECRGMAKKRCQTCRAVPEH